MKSSAMPTARRSLRVLCRLGNGLGSSAIPLMQADRSQSRKGRFKFRMNLTSTSGSGLAVNGIDIASIVIWACCRWGKRVEEWEVVENFLILCRRPPSRFVQNSAR